MKCTNPAALYPPNQFCHRVGNGPGDILVVDADDAVILPQPDEAGRGGLLHLAHPHRERARDGEPKTFAASWDAHLKFSMCVF